MGELDFAENCGLINFSHEDLVSINSYPSFHIKSPIFTQTTSFQTHINSSIYNS